MKRINPTLILAFSCLFLFTQCRSVSVLRGTAEGATIGLAVGAGVGKLLGNTAVGGLSGALIGGSVSALLSIHAKKEKERVVFVAVAAKRAESKNRKASDLHLKYAAETDILTQVQNLQKQIDSGVSFANQRIILYDLAFDPSLCVMADSSGFYVDQVIRFMEINPTITVQVLSHTEGDSLDFSEKRALSVYNYIISKGVLSSRLSHKSVRDSKSVASNETEADRGLNRSVEFVIDAHKKDTQDIQHK
jgi:outer membrane protein OmpA-like peptidoglycan-associated protein